MSQREGSGSPEADLREAASELSGDMDEDQALDRFARSRISMVLTDATAEDNPIVYVNQAFEVMSGYSSAVALGQNCRFLQGEDSDPDAVRRMREAVAACEEVSLDILNYRADGSSFVNRLMISPIMHEDECTHFVGLHMPLGGAGNLASSPVLDQHLKEIQHRVKNHLSMVISLIRTQSRQAMDPVQFQALARRVEALQLLYEEMSNEAGGDDQIPMGSYLSRIATTIAHLDGRAGVRCQIEVEAVNLPIEQATPIGLILSEVMTNAFQHAFEGRDAGQVNVRMERLSDRALRLTVSDDGVGMAEGVTWPDGASLGGRLVAGLLKSVDSSVDVHSGGTGTVVTIEVPSRK